MPNIFVYHKNSERGEYISKALRHYYKKTDRPYSIILQNDQDTAVKWLKRNASVADILFIDASDADVALSLVKAFRVQNLQASWIWLEGERERLYESLILRPSGYVEDLSDAKELLRIIHSVDQFYKLIEKKRDFVFKFEGDYVHIPFKDICYFESNAKKVILHLRDRTHMYYFTSKLEDIQKMLPEHFLRCHQSYIVNLEEVRKLDVKEHLFVLNNNDDVLISRRHYAEAKALYEEFLEKKVGAELPI